jgi:hypothetical protein
VTCCSRPGPAGQQACTARLLPRLIRAARRARCCSPAATPGVALPAAGDTDPASGRARLSYRQAEQLFKDTAGGATLHQFRHSALTGPQGTWRVDSRRGRPAPPHHPPTPGAPAPQERYRRLPTTTPCDTIRTTGASTSSAAASTARGPTPGCMPVRRDQPAHSPAARPGPIRRGLDPGLTSRAQPGTYQESAYTPLPLPDTP